MATGVVAAPVIGMGVGALNQVAPRAARVVAGGLKCCTGSKSNCCCFSIRVDHLKLILQADEKAS
jgi:TRAP-type mannitol/chloroaromatic compound transport system permease large subunit